MKTLISYVALTVFVLASSFTIDVQQNLNQKPADNCFNYFRAHRQGKAGVGLAWAVSAADVNRFVIEKSYDGEFYEDATAVNFNGAAAYRFTDKEVFPGYIFYRIRAEKSDGTTEFSPVETIHIVQRH